MIIAALLAASATPSPGVAYRVDPRHRIVEGIASDGRDLFVSSLIDRTILRCRSACAPAFQLGGPAHPMGLAWDAKRRWLWIAMHCPKLPGVTPCEGELRAVDRKGRVKYSGRPSSNFRPGDVSAAGGTVIVSDSANGAAYRLENGKFVTMIAPGIGKSGQGSWTLPDGSAVVADYSQGIARIDPVSGQRTLLKRIDGRPIRGIDGLIGIGGRLFAIYNGAAPGQLVELTIGADATSLSQVPAAGLLPDPTHVTWHRGSLYVVGDSGWATIDKESRRALGATIIRFPGRSVSASARVSN